VIYARLKGGKGERGRGLGGAVVKAEVCGCDKKKETVSFGLKQSSWVSCNANDGFGHSSIICGDNPFTSEVD
jgi:hypothetical protein